MEPVGREKNTEYGFNVIYMSCNALFHTAAELLINSNNNIHQAQLIRRQRRETEKLSQSQMKAAAEEEVVGRGLTLKVCQS